MKRIGKWLLFCILPGAMVVQAAFEETPVSARTVGMGMTGAANDGLIENVWINPACLGTIRNWQCALSITRPFGIRELTKQSLCVGHPFYCGSFALSMQAFGSNHYQEQQLGLSYAMELENRLQLGLRVRAGRVQIDRYGSTQTWMTDAGLLYPLSAKFRIGASLHNLFRTRIGVQREALPQSLRVGIASSPADNITLNLDCIKDHRYPAQLACGLEIQVIPVWRIRAGFSNQPDYLCAGTGFRIKDWIIDYGLAVHPLLGSTHQVSLLYLDLTP